jgi:hypothetical protein
MENKKLRRMNPLPPQMAKQPEKDVPPVAKRSEEKVWQVNTHGDLCASKVIVASREEITRHLDKVVRITEEYRKSLAPEVLNLVAWEKKVSQEEIERSFCLTVIDKIRRTNWKKIFFTMDGVNVKNLRSFVDYVIRKDKNIKQKNDNASNK